MNMMLQPPGTRADGDYNDCASDDEVDYKIAVMMNVEPLISVLAAYLILGQAITIVQSLGIIGVVLGIVLMSYTRSD